MKKLFLLLLVLVLSLSVLCACNGDGSTDGGNTDGGSTDTGNTDGGNTDGGDTETAYFTEGLSFTVLQNGTCVLTGMGTATDIDVVIPAEHEGKPVVAIGNSVFGRYKNLKSVTIPATVKEIRKTAFADCATLESVTFAEGSVLESIGEDAFYYCSELKSVTIPASVKTIGANAFYACKKLLSVTFADGSALEKIEKAAFSDCSALKSVSIPASVTEIGANAFAKCAALESVALPAGKLTAIGASAFAHCSALTEIIIPEGVQTIGDSAFLCAGIETISIPASVNTIGATPLAECVDLKTITVAQGNDVYYSAGNCLVNDETKTLIAGCKTGVIPADRGIKFIADSAFKSCEGLKSITIPATVERIYAYAFYNCTGLSSVLFAENCALKSIGEHAFETCSSLKEIVFPAALQSIGGYAFQYSKNLKSVLFESGSALRSFGGYAFYKCESLSLIMIPQNVNSIGRDTFSGTIIKSVYLHSYTVSGMLTDKEACSGLFRSATAVAITANVDNPTSYLTQNYLNKNDITYQGVSYTLYAKHTHNAWSAYTKGDYTGETCPICLVVKDIVS